MTISKRSLLAVATTTTALILTACVAPPAAKPTPGPTTTAVPAPVVPRLCSEIGEDPAGVLGSPLLQQVAPAARSASPPAGSDTEPLDPDELPEPLDPDGVRATAEWIANDSRDLPDGDRPLVAMTVGAVLEGRPVLHTILQQDPDAAVQEASGTAALVAAAGGEVVAVERDPVVETAEMGGYPVDDAFRDEQWALDMFDFEDTWCASTGEGITVAVVDTGVDAQHPDLVGKVVSQVDLSLDSLLQNSDAGRPGRHGTHVAGTIAAIPNNSIGTAGVAPGVDIIDVKALTAADSIGTQGLVAKAIVHAVDAGAEVINLSVGFPCDQTEDGGFAAADPKIESCALGNGTAALDLAAGYAKANDVVMAVAAGNDGSATVPGDGGEVPNPTHNIWNVPAALDWSLAVGSMGQERRMSVFSTQASYVDIAGPGSDVLSTTFDDEGATWEPMSGTSMATPHVAGLVAVLRGAFPSESAAQIVSRVTGSAAPFGNGDTTDAGDGCPVGTAKAWCFGVGVIDPGASVRWGRT